MLKFLKYLFYLIILNVTVFAVLYFIGKLYFPFSLYFAILGTTASISFSIFVIFSFDNIKLSNIDKKYYIVVIMTKRGKRLKITPIQEGNIVYTTKSKRRAEKKLKKISKKLDISIYRDSDNFYY
ncbi:MAG TPA: hypothetical protein VKN74_01930 [Candidatus Mcinerneyibacterium sp.]|nr:hypothetical protein [Candidatus Mcinerneyibacterium sp.]